MSKFRVGQRVRLVIAHDPLDWQEAATVGQEGVVIGGGRYFDDIEASYDCVVAFPSYESLCCWNWQLEPATDSYDVVSWDACVWKPEHLRVGA